MVPPEAIYFYCVVRFVDPSDAVAIVYVVASDRAAFVRCGANDAASYGEYVPHGVP